MKREKYCPVWNPLETTTHQDHVIAHVIGSTVLGYFVVDEALYFVLDMGFIWRIYLDGEMGLLPGTIAVDELAVNERLKQTFKTDVELLLRKGEEAAAEIRETALLEDDCLIQAVELFSQDDKRRLILHGEESDLLVETSLSTRGFEVGSHRGETE
jgi:hypothetical protein